jgi:hypothetical protein
MPQVRFDPTISVFELEETVHALDRALSVIGNYFGTVEGFLRVLLFPLTILIPPTAPHSSSIIRGWYNRPISGRRTKWTQSQPTPTHERNS